MAYSGVPGTGDLGDFELGGPGDIWVLVPAAVLTLTGPAPEIGTIHIDVPAGVITLTAPGPIAAIAIPRALVTLSSVAPRTAYVIPAAVVTTSGPVPTVRAGTVVSVPAALILLGVQARVSTFATGSAASTTSPIRVYMDGFEISGNVMWGATTEEVLGGTGSAQLEVHDPTNAFDPEPHQEVYIDVRATGWPLFHGETMTPAFEIIPARQYAVWTIPCRDYNAQLAERLVGAPDGTNFWRPDVTTPFEAIDPDAISRATDKITVQQWLRAYFRLPTGLLPDTGTRVFQYVDNGFLGRPENIMWLYNATTTLQSALEELASTADVNVQFGLHPDDKFYWWEIVPWQTLTAGGSQGDLPSAPVALGTGGTAIRLALKGTKDGQAQAQALYVQGANGWAYSPEISALPVSGGSGWYPFKPNPSMRQAYLGSSQSWTEERKNVVGDSAYRRAANPTLRMSAQVIEANMGGFRVGQVATVTKDILPDSITNGAGVGKYVIQRVLTSLLPGSTHLATTLDLGDGAVSRIMGSTRNQIEAGVDAGIAKKAKPIVKDLFVDFDNISPIKHGDRRTFTAVPQNELAAYYNLTGATIVFVLHVYDPDTEVELTTGFDATIDPSSAAADRDGRARGTLIADSTTDYKYRVGAYITVVPA